jgi:hypothetical protein
MFALYNMVENLGFLSISLFMGLYYSLHMAYSNDPNLGDDVLCWNEQRGFPLDWCNCFENISLINV